MGQVRFSLDVWVEFIEDVSFEEKVKVIETFLSQMTDWAVDSEYLWMGLQELTDKELLDIQVALLER